MDKAVGAAREAFDRGPWPRLSHAQRSQYLRAIATAFADFSERLGNIWSTEVGVLHSVSSRSAAGHPHGLHQYADMAADFPFLERHTPTAGGIAGFLVREPVGVVGIIVPWNGPMGLITRKLAPALLAGCTTVIKVAPEAPGAGYIMAEIAEQVGLPPGVINVVTADRPVSEMLVTDPRIDKIAFTGSTAAGRRIASLCGARVARVSLELGGKSAAQFSTTSTSTPLPNRSSARHAWYAGRSFILTRIIVGRAHHDELVEALSSRFARVRVGDPFDAKSEMGPLTMRRQRDRVEGFIAKGIEQGATLATGGGRPSIWTVASSLSRQYLAMLRTTPRSPRRRSSGPCSASSPPTARTTPLTSPTILSSDSTHPCLPTTPSTRSKFPQL